MYPATALENEILTWEDLPETLYDALNDRTFTRVEPYEEGGVTIYYESADIAEEPQAIYIDGAGTPWEWNSGTIPSAGGPCLITGDGNYTPGNDAVEDTFADTYTLKIDGAIGGFVQGSCENFSRPDDVVLIRTSLCVWRADNVEINVFGGGDGPEDPCNDGFTITITAILSFTGVGWEVAFGGLAGPKNSDENQNTPVGWYGDFMEIVE
jgi:hypothetical protein